MRKHRQWIAILLALTLLLMAAACGQSGETSSSVSSGNLQSGNSAPQDSSTEVSESVESKNVTLQLILPSNATDFPEGMSENDNFIIDYWEEQTGYDFDIVILPQANEQEKLNLMFSGGEVTGMVFQKDLTSPARFYNQGVLQPFDDYVEGSYFFDTFSEYQSKGVFDGQQYAAMIPPDGIPCSSSLYVVRKDILNSIGITEQPATFDDFTEMLRIIKQGTDMIPLAVYDSPCSVGWDVVAAMFGVSNSHNNWAVRDGKVVYRFTQPEGYDYLTYCKMLYDEGLIPQDTLSLTLDATEQLYLGGQAASYVAAGCWNMPTIIPASEEQGYDSRFMDFPTGYYGQVSTGFQDRFFSQAVYLSALADNPADYVSLLDFLAQPDTIKVNNYGIEGEHYTEDAEGNITLTDAGNDLQWAVYYRNIFLPEDWYNVYGVNANWAEYYYPSERHSVGATDFDPVEFMPQDADDVALQSELQETIVDQYYASALTGEIELTEESFNNMVQEWLNAGGQQLQDTYTEQYQEMGSPDFSSNYVSYLPEDHPAYTGKYLWDGHE